MINNKENISKIVWNIVRQTFFDSKLVGLAGAQEDHGQNDVNELSVNDIPYEIIPLIKYAMEKDVSRWQAIPQHLRDYFIKCYHKQLGISMLLHNNLSKIVHAFNEENVDLMLLKGAALSKCLYPTIVTRPMGDIDLLVQKKALPQARDILQRLGYLQKRNQKYRWPFKHHPFHQIFYNRENHSHPIELHWGMSQWPFRIDVDGIWKRRIESKEGNIRFFSLELNDLIVYLAFHAAYSGFSRPLWIVDIALLISKYFTSIDWDIIARRAHEWQVNYSVYYSLAVVKEHLDAPIPEKFLAQLHPPDKEIAHFVKSFISPAVTFQNKQLIDTRLEIVREIMQVPGIVTRLSTLLVRALKMFSRRSDWMIKRYSPNSRLPRSLCNIVMQLSQAASCTIGIVWTLINIMFYQEYGRCRSVRHSRRDPRTTPKNFSE